MASVNLEVLPIEKWGIFEDVKRPIIIAGPCSAENEAQVMDTARQLKEDGVKIFRAGIWKPRTRPNCFEGIGIPGLAWLRWVKDELGMVITPEVANGGHVEEALKAGVDILWVGARTAANPFSVQNIAEALRGVDIPVLLKNPVNPDVDLWIGALEHSISWGLSVWGLSIVVSPHMGRINIEICLSGRFPLSCVVSSRIYPSLLTRVTWRDVGSMSRSFRKRRWI